MIAKLMSIPFGAAGGWMFWNGDYKIGLIYIAVAFIISEIGRKK